MEFAADLCGSHGFGEKGPDADLPGFDITAYWARSGLLSMTRDAGEPPTWPVAGSGDNATAVGLYSAIVTALYRRSAPGRGRMSRRRCLPRVSGPQASPSRRLSARRILRPSRSKESRKCGAECVSGFGWRLVPSCRYAGQAPRRRKSNRPRRSADRSALRRSSELTQNMAELPRFSTKSSARSR